MRGMTRKGIIKMTVVMFIVSTDFDMYYSKKLVAAGENNEEKK